MSERGRRKEEIQKINKVKKVEERVV